MLGLAGERPEVSRGLRFFGRLVSKSGFLIMLANLFDCSADPFSSSEIEVGQSSLWEIQMLFRHHVREPRCLFTNLAVMQYDSQSSIV